MFIKKIIHIRKLLFISIILNQKAYGAATQILSDTFYQNPAELSLVNKSQIIAGNLFINPSFKFQGNSFEANGSAKSNVTDYLPYILGAYRASEEIVIEVNITPSGYGHLNWPVDSFVSQASTLTKLLYYRFGFQSSYQITENLAVGMGFNIEDNGQYQLNFVVPGQGNQVNSVKGLNYTGDFGLYYKINPKNYLTVAGYTQVDTYGYGSSSAGGIVNNNLSLNITEAPVIYVGLEHFANDLWFIEGVLNANRRFFRTFLIRLPSRKLWKISSFLSNTMLIKNRNHSLTIYLS